MASSKQRYWPHVAFAIVVSFLIGNGAIAQESDQVRPKLATIFSDAVDAVGGIDAVNSVRNLTAIAECQGPEGEYRSKIVSFDGGKTIFSQTFTYKDKKTLIMVNGKHAWSVDAVGEPTVISPFHRLVVKLHEFQQLSFAFERAFTDFEFIGVEVFNDQPSLKIRAKHELGGEIFLLFDQESKRLAGYILPNPGTDEAVVNTFVNWEKVGDLVLPSVVTAVDSSGTWTLRFTEIEMNKADEADCDVPERIVDITELLRLQKQARKAHLTYNAELFVDMFADQVTQVSNGVVETQTKTENLERFKQYFESYEFEKWEDAEPPTITLSQDGMMATVVVQKLVSGRPKNAHAKGEFHKTEYAWVEVWEKIKGEWKVVTVASTTKPVSD